MPSRLIQRMNLDAADEMIAAQMIGRSLCMQPTELPPSSDERYLRSEDFWSDVLRERLYAERNVELIGFRLFEWFPRNPGLFHTDDGHWARQAAQYDLIEIDSRAYEAISLSADAEVDHAEVFRSITEGEGALRTKVYAPQGKLSMLQGGVGCIRLQHVEVAGRDSVSWFMSASSSIAPDEGVPLLVPNDLYQQHIGRIRERGFATVNIWGRLRFIPEQFADLYALRSGIPRLYMEVDDIKDGGPDEGHGRVSVATSFLSSAFGRPAIHAAYVTFDPGFPGARRSATDWMRKEYVEQLYEGDVLTDFDQQAPTLSGTLFSLDQVLTSGNIAELLHGLKQLHGFVDLSMLKERTIDFTLHTEEVRLKIQANDNSGTLAISTGDNSPINVGAVNLGELANQLARLRSELGAEPPSIERDLAVGPLAEAEQAAQVGDRSQVSSALARLKPVAKKVVDIGERIGVGIATAAITSSVGF